MDPGLAIEESPSGKWTHLRLPCRHLHQPLARTDRIWSQIHVILVTAVIVATLFNIPVGTNLHWLKLTAIASTISISLLIACQDVANAHSLRNGKSRSEIWIGNGRLCVREVGFFFGLDQN